MTISNEAIELAAMAIMCVGEEVWELQTPRIKEAARSDARAALEAAAPMIRAGTLEDAAKDLAQLPYVKPDQPGRAEYESVLAVRRGNTDAWLRARAAG